MTTEEEWAKLTTDEKDENDTSDPVHTVRPRRVAVWPDLHVPYHSVERVEEAFAQTVGADHIVLLGDCFDGYWLSSFDKDPGRKETTQDELDVLGKLLERLRRENPRARIDYILGNHEERLMRYLRSRAPGLAGLRALDLRNLLGLDAIDVRLHNRDGFVAYGRRFKHGNLVRSKAGYTARAEMERHRISGYSGHTHRFGEATLTDAEGVTTHWWECGHLCDESAAEYVASPDWQAGMMLLNVYPDGEVEDIPVRM